MKSVRGAMTSHSRSYGEELQRSNGKNNFALYGIDNEYEWY
ncbi:hypothetical protein [Parashewanella hymeniacidonis]|nr:hypothetical protein [Parashewanella hymeniacidonis]